MNKIADANIYSFLKNGLIDKIQLDMSLLHFLKSYSLHINKSFENDSTVGYYYQIFEIIFYKERISSISINYRDLNKAFVKIDDNVLKFNKKLTLSMVLDFFRLLEIDWNFNKIYCFDKQLCIETESNVNLLFNYSDKKGFLEKIIK